MMCEECSREAEWLIVTPGVEWIGRVCSDHLRGSGMHPKAQVHLRPEVRA